MKASFYFSRLILIAAAALVAGSCNPKMDVPFQITYPNYTYVIQTQSEGITSFTPVIGFATTSSSSKIVSGEVFKGTISLGGDVYLDERFETSFSENSTEALTSLNGEYTVKATDNKGAIVTDNFSYAFIPADVMHLGEGVDKLQVSEFTYSNYKITAKIAPVGQATHYLFFMVPVLPANFNTPDNGPEINTLLLHESSTLLTLNTEQEITWSYIPYYAYDYWIYPAAARKTSTGYILIFGEGKLLRNGATTFTEGE